MKRVWRRPALLPLVVAAGVGMAVGGGAYAVAGQGAGAIRACVKKHGGELYKAEKCARGDTPLTWNVQGPQGATGPRGAQGAQGLQGAPGSAGAGATAINYSSADSGATKPFATLGGVSLSATCAWNSEPDQGQVDFELNGSGAAWNAGGFAASSGNTTGFTASAPPNTSTLVTQGIAGATSDGVWDFNLTSGGSVYTVFVTYHITWGSDVGLGSCSAYGTVIPAS